MGISRESLLRVLKDDILTNLIREAVSSARRGDSDELVGVIQALFEYVSSPRFRALFFEEFGVGLFRRPLTRLVTYLFPFMGWRFLIPLFLSAINRFLHTETSNFR